MVEDNIIQDFVNTIKSDQQENTKTYLATVSRVESDGSVFVRIAGSDIETPTAMTSAEVSRGDIVNVEWRNNKLYIAGNSTNPSVGVVRVEAVEAATQVANEAAANAVQEAGRARDAADTAEAAAHDAQDTANAVHDIAQQAADDATEAHDAAESAQGSADSALVGLSTVQDVVGVLNWITAHGTMTSQSGGTFDPDQVYFVRDDSTPGDYHVGSHYYSIVSEPKAADINSYYVLTVDESVQNYVATHIVVDSEGLWIIPDAGGNKVLIATGSGSTYTTAGTYIVGKVGGVDTVLASFTASGAVIGKAAGAHTSIDDDGMQIYSVDSLDNVVNLANIGYGEGNAQSGTAIAPYYTFGTRKTTASAYDSTSTYDVGDLCIYGGAVYVCVVKISVAEPWTNYHWKRDIGNYSVATGNNVVASGSCSHAEGNGTIANGWLAHAEGEGTLAAGSYSHAEGSYTTATNFNSHAEGYNTYAGSYAHAEGHSSEASGYASHAQNQGTTASYNYQTTIGQFNDNQNDTAFEIGNGTADNARSNALTVDWSGNVEAAGDVTDGAGNVLANKRSAAFVRMYHGNQALNNTARKITGLSISTGGNYSDYFDVGTADQVTIKKTGGYRIDMAMRFSAVTNAANVKRISLYRNGSEFVVLMSRASSWEDFSTFYTQDLSVGDVLTMYGRSEDGNATASIERIYIEPIP